MQWTLGIYPAKLGLYYAQVVSRFDGGVHAHTRWGSSSGRNTSNFTYRLCMMPLSTIDYLVVHDLGHTRVKNHSVKFWNEVADIRPDFTKERAYLKKNGIPFSLEYDF